MNRLAMKVVAFSAGLICMAVGANASVLKTIAGGGVQGVDNPVVGASATSIFTQSYAVQQGLTRHYYFPSYDMDGLSSQGVIRVDPYGKVDWMVSGLAKYVDDIAVDIDGSVLVIENDQSVPANRVVRYSLDGSSAVVAGAGPRGDAGDGGPATDALLGRPEGLAVDENGNIYVATMDKCLVRKVDRSTGIISTVAGNIDLGCGFNYTEGATNLATGTQLGIPRKIAFDKAGNLLIPDGTNQVVWKVDIQNDIIARIAGTAGISGYAGDGGPAVSATFNGSRGVDVDQWGNIFVVDRNNNVVRKIDSAGVITTVAGNGTAGYLDHVTDPTQGMLNSPADVSVDLDGQLYIADYFNQLIRRVSFSPAIQSILPISGPVGTKVVIKGKYFGSFKGQGTITLGALTIPATNVTNWSNTELHVTIPAGAVDGNFSVSAEGGVSNDSVRFNVK